MRDGIQLGKEMDPGMPPAEVELPDWRENMVLNPVATREKVFAFFSWKKMTFVCLLVLAVAIPSVAVENYDFPIFVSLDAPTERKCREVCENSLKDPKTLDEGSEERKEIKFAIKQIGGPAFSCQEPFRNGQCSIQFKRPMWHTLFTAGVFVFCVAWCFLGAPPDILLPGGTVLLAMVRIISPKVPFGALSDNGVLLLAVMFPISDAVSATGLLDVGVNLVLGTPTSMFWALIRMMCVVVPLSAFLNNTAVVTLMIPILVNWARMLDVHPGKFLMPLSFAAQLGGSLTKIGSSSCIIGATIVEMYSEPMGKKQYKMELFDLMPCGFIICVLTQVVIAFLAQTSLLRSSTEQQQTIGMDGEISDLTEPMTTWISQDWPALYKVLFSVIPDGPVEGLVLPGSRLTRTPGVYILRKQHSHEEDASPICRDDVIEVWADALGVSNMRDVEGLVFEKESDLALLGSNRQKRFLYEIVIRGGSELASSDVLRSAGKFRFAFGAAFIAGPKQNPDNETNNHVTTGSVILVEADERWVDDIAAKRWTDSCTLMSKIPASSPKRIGYIVDAWRRVAVCVSLMLVIILAAIPPLGISLHMSCCCLLGFYIAIRAVKPENIYRSIGIRIIMTIVGAMAFGKALNDVGIVRCVCQLVLGRVSNTFLIYTFVYILASLLGLAVNNTAVAALIGPMVVSLKEENPDISLRALTWMLIYASGSCFLTPLGYQTNLMVMPAGKYSFGDFFKFGCLVKLVHLAIASLTCWIVGEKILS